MMGGKKKFIGIGIMTVIGIVAVIFAGSKIKAAKAEADRKQLQKDFFNAMELSTGRWVADDGSCAFLLFIDDNSEIKVRTDLFFDKETGTGMLEGSIPPGRDYTGYIEIVPDGQKINDEGNITLFPIGKTGENNDCFTVAINSLPDYDDYVMKKAVLGWPCYPDYNPDYNNVFRHDDAIQSIDVGALSSGIVYHDYYLLNGMNGSNYLLIRCSEQPVFSDTLAYDNDPIAWAVEKGITNGTGDNTFSPNATCTRGQIVTFLYRA